MSETSFDRDDLDSDPWIERAPELIKSLALKISPIFGTVQERWQRYLTLSPIPRNLTRLSYTDLEAYLTSPGHPFDEIITGLEEAMDAPHLIRVVAGRYGFSIPGGFATDDWVLPNRIVDPLGIFIDKFTEYLAWTGIRAPNEPHFYSQGDRLPTTGEMMNYDRDQFARFKRRYNLSLGDGDSDQLYYDRLWILGQVIRGLLH